MGLLTIPVRATPNARILARRHVDQLEGRGPPSDCALFVVTDHSPMVLENMSGTLGYGRRQNLCKSEFDWPHPRVWPVAFVYPLTE